MRRWTAMLGGLIVWAAHFFAVYIIGSLFPGTLLARWLTAAATLVALTLATWQLWRALAGRRDADGDRLDRWMNGVAAAASALAVVAIIYQGLPALLA